MEWLKRQARLFTQLGFPEDGVMAVLAVDGEVDADAVVFGQRPERRHWEEYQRLINRRHGRLFDV